MSDGLTDYIDRFGELPVSVVNMDEEKLEELERLFEIAVERGTPLTEKELKPFRDLNPEDSDT